MKLVAAHLLFLFLCMNSQPSAVTIDPLNWKEFLLSESSLTGKCAQQQIENKQAAILWLFCRGFIKKKGSLDVT